MAHALSQVCKRHGLSFRDAYRRLLDAGAIVHMNPANDIEPDENDARFEPGPLADSLLKQVVSTLEPSAIGKIGSPMR